MDDLVWLDIFGVGEKMKRLSLSLNRCRIGTALLVAAIATATVSIGSMRLEASYGPGPETPLAGTPSDVAIFLPLLPDGHRAKRFADCSPVRGLVAAADGGLYEFHQQRWARLNATSCTSRDVRAFLGGSGATLRATDGNFRVWPAAPVWEGASATSMFIAAGGPAVTVAFSQRFVPRVGGLCRLRSCGGMSNQPITTKVDIDGLVAGGVAYLVINSVGYRTRTNPLMLLPLRRLLQQPPGSSLCIGNIAVTWMRRGQSEPTMSACK